MPSKRPEHTTAKFGVEQLERQLPTSIPEFVEWAQNPTLLLQKYTETQLDMDVQQASHCDCSGVHLLLAL